MNRILIGTLLIGLLSACASTPPSSTQPGSLSSVKATATNNSIAATPAKVQQSDLAPYKDSSNSLLSQKRSVFFEFDQYVIGDEYRPMIEAHAKYLAGNRSQKIKIEGNADERGSSEYNLALGQKRAHAVMKAMRVLGVHEDQIEAISWGRERPKAMGHDESAWAQNRRADIKYGNEK